MDICSWLKKQMVSTDAYDADQLLDGFLSEMRRGLEGASSSLAMIPAYVGIKGDVKPGRPVAVIDAGGTNLRIGIARFDEAGKIELSNFTKQAMPGRDHQISAAEFYKVLVDALEPLKDQFENIGFCFSYRLKSGRIWTAACFTGPRKSKFRNWSENRSAKDWSRRWKRAA